jgi:outer membrane usher protein
MLSWFGPAGLLQLTTALRSVNSSPAALGSSVDKKFIRLGTTFLRDDPEHLTTWSVGDAVLQAGTGVPGVRYGGITWQSNFGLNPAFSTLETPTLFDSARLPSTLEFFLNDRRVGAPVMVAPGPFEITGLPTVGVNGMVNVLIRDALNNERLIAVPYLHTASLYRQGLHGFSYTAGLLRPDLDQYATPFLASSHRWGITRLWTLDAGAAVSAHQSSAGAGATTALFGDVIGNLHLAVSHAPSGAGQKLGTSAQWQDSRASMGASYSHASSGFELLGDATQAANRPRDELRVFAARALGRALGSFSISLGSLSDWSGHTRGISSIGWSKSVGSANVSLGAVHTAGNTLLQFMVNLPLERRAYGSASVQKQGQNLSARTDYTTAPVTGKGLAWRLGLAANDSDGTQERTRASAGMDMRSDFGEHGLDVVNSANGVAWRARTAGSVGLLAGHGFYGPPIHGGFALVSTGDAPDIPVYRWNLPVAVSDSRGMALVTTLSPYQKNLLAIKPEDVPLQYRVASHEITAIPRGRGGVLVNFAVVRERPALVVLWLPDGRPVPVGASVHVSSSGETAPVGLRGEVYLQNLPVQTELTVRLQGKTCQVFVAHPASQDPQPRLGPWVCAWRETP